jgi:hypothetical protein
MRLGVDSLFVGTRRSWTGNLRKVPPPTMAELQIYFAGSIRGGRSDAHVYAALIARLEAIGRVMTEHVGADELGTGGESGLSDEEIHARDVGWLRRCDVLVAEVSTPSLGVGYELGRAEAMGKPVICLYRPASERPLSAMVAGNPWFRVVHYRDPQQGVDAVRQVLEADASRGGPNPTGAQ